MFHKAQYLTMHIQLPKIDLNDPKQVAAYKIEASNYLLSEIIAYARQEAFYEEAQVLLRNVCNSDEEADQLLNDTIRQVDAHTSIKAIIDDYK